MANELQASYVTGRSGYCLIRPATSGSLIWNNLSGTWVNYSTALYAGYPINMTEQGTASAYYVGSMPTGIGPGTYNVVFKNMTGSTPAETDATADAGSIDWTGSAVRSLADMATSGQIAQYLPQPLAKGYMVRNFPLHFVSSADHVTPLVSGVVSGMVALDGATTFTALQNGGATELGYGDYWVYAINSGELNGAAAMLRFVAVGVSGGSADPINIGVPLQPIAAH